MESEKAIFLWEKLTTQDAMFALVIGNGSLEIIEERL